jgi:peptidyl-tRNA hydrolase, PTH2 family
MHDDIITIRKDDEDPLTCYLIVRESLGMSAGKACAQCSHAAQYLQVEYHELNQRLDRYYGGDKLVPPTMEELLKASDYKDWMKKGVRKVVLRADDKEWEKLKECYKAELESGGAVIVRDAGLTEIPSGSETCIGLWPVKKSFALKIVQRLQKLK